MLSVFGARIPESSVIASKVVRVSIVSVVRFGLTLDVFVFVRIEADTCTYVRRIDSTSLIPGSVDCEFSCF